LAVKQASASLRCCRVLETAAPRACALGACDALFTPRPLCRCTTSRVRRKARCWRRSVPEHRDEIFTAALDELEKTAALSSLKTCTGRTKRRSTCSISGAPIHRTRAMLAVTYRRRRSRPAASLRFVLGDLPRATRAECRCCPFEPAVARLAKRAGRHRKACMSYGRQPILRDRSMAGSPARYRTQCATLFSRADHAFPAAREIAELVSVVP